MPNYFYLDRYTPNGIKNNKNIKFQKGRSIATLKHSNGTIWKGFVLDEELNISISNEFENNSLGLNSFIENKVSPYQRQAAILNAANDRLKDLDTSGLSPELAALISSAKNISNDVLDSVNDLVKSITNEELSTLANSYIDTVDSYLYMFKGTNIDIPAKFSMLLVTDTINHDIYDDLSEILNFLVGDFVTSDSVGGIIGYQTAPHGYEMSLGALIASNGNEDIKGTWTLNLYNDDNSNGPSFPGLVISGCDLNISSVSCPVRNKGIGGFIYRPMSIQLEFSLKSVIKYTKEILSRYLTHKLK